jgi:hypothetical protein
MIFRKMTTMSWQSPVGSHGRRYLMKNGFVTLVPLLTSTALRLEAQKQAVD